MNSSEQTIVPVILAGGRGTRLWPLSRSMRPKQFIDLLGDNSLFQMTLTRLAALSHLAPPLIVCNEQHRFMVAEQLRQLDLAHDGILLEPFGRNTATAIAVAAHKLSLHNQQPNALMLVLPADHLIESGPALARAIAHARRAAQRGDLVTFGVKPHYAATGYGYIQARAAAGGAAVAAERFVEKPDPQTAQAFFDSGEYFWNSGMFLFQAARYLQELAESHAAMVQGARRAVENAQADLDFIRLHAASYADCADISVDYALMERAACVSMVALAAEWSDIGSWASLWHNGAKDAQGNVVRGDVVVADAHNCYLRAENKLLAVQGVEDLVVVETHDSVMVGRRHNDQSLKQLVAQLEQAGRSETQLHRQVFRPWGHYDCLDQGDGFQVKRITVNSGQATSLQKHFHRAEHWTVVAGQAEVTCGDKTFILGENESTYIPLGTLHRLRNPGPTSLELIEVQSGAYLSEDDIERVDDQYGRAE